MTMIPTFILDPKFPKTALVTGPALYRDQLGLVGKSTYIVIDKIIPDLDLPILVDKSYKKVYEYNGDEVLCIEAGRLDQKKFWILTTIDYACYQKDKQWVIKEPESTTLELLQDSTYLLNVLEIMIKGYLKLNVHVSEQAYKDMFRMHNLWVSEQFSYEAFENYKNELKGVEDAYWDI